MCTIKVVFVMKHIYRHGIRKEIFYCKTPSLMIKTHVQSNFKQFNTHRFFHHLDVTYTLLAKLTFLTLTIFSGHQDLFWRSNEQRES